MTLSLSLPHDVKVEGLRALLSVIIADGRREEHEQKLLSAVAQALSLEVDLDELTPATPEETAVVITDPVHRERLVQAQLVTALIDGEASEAETLVIAAFASALEVEEPRLRNLQHVMHGHLRWLQFDLMRRSPMVGDVAKHAWERDGLRGVWKAMAPLMPGRVLAQDPALAQRYLDLERLPEGTFGRTYFEHMRARGFTFPGQRAASPRAS
jgi:tellurite resistance protein